MSQVSEGEKALSSDEGPQIVEPFPGYLKNLSALLSGDASSQTREQALPETLLTRAFAWFRRYERGLDCAGASEAAYFEDHRQALQREGANDIDAAAALCDAWKYCVNNPDMQQEIVVLLSGQPVVSSSQLSPEVRDVHGR